MPKEINSMIILIFIIKVTKYFCFLLYLASVISRYNLGAFCLFIPPFVVNFLLTTAYLSNIISFSFFSVMLNNLLILVTLFGPNLLGT